MNNKLLQVNNLNYSYDKVTVFNNFNFCVAKNGLISFIGSNLSGKTTLIKLLSGLLPSKGSVLYNGESKIDRRQVGVLLDDIDNQFLFDDVYHELAYPLENLNYPLYEISSRIKEVTKLLEIDELIEKKIDRLTTSEKIKVLIAVTLIHNPKLVLLDNPFKYFNKKDRIKYQKILSKIARDKNKIIIITSTNLIDSYHSDYMYVIEKGNIIIEGHPYGVLKEDKLLRKLNYDIPFMVDLSNYFRLYDLINDIELDIDRMVNTLWN